MPINRNIDNCCRQFNVALIASTVALSVFSSRRSASASSLASAASEIPIVPSVMPARPTPIENKVPLSNAASIPSSDWPRIARARLITRSRDSATGGAIPGAQTRYRLDCEPTVILQMPPFRPVNWNVPATLVFAFRVFVYPCRAIT